MITKQEIKEYIAKHVFSTILVVISTLFAVIPCFICLFLFLPENKWYGVLFFVPTVFIAALCYLSGLYRGKHSKILKILIILLNVLILFFIQTICAFGFLLICTTSDANTIINHPKRYSIVLKSLKGDKKIMHFPENIPNNAQNTVLFKESCIRGGDIVYLRFIAPKEYIDNEIEKYHYVKIEGPFDEAKKYESNYPRDFIFGEERNQIDSKKYRDKIEDYKIYVIGNKNSYDSSRPCEYGIAVNDKTNTIIYYASNPD